MRKKGTVEKSCGNCARCWKYMSGGKECWSCEESEHGIGMPVDCYPPHDEACRNWTDDPEDNGRLGDALRNLVDHFWDDDDWDDYDWGDGD